MGAAQLQSDAGLPQPLRQVELLYLCQEPLRGVQEWPPLPPLQPAAERKQAGFAEPLGPVQER